jgi:hypothetical protein
VRFFAKVGLDYVSCSPYRVPIARLAAAQAAVGFNSRATFDDPSVRQFFPSVAAYSDYYASLVDVLDRGNIRNNQPTRIELLGLSSTADGVLKLSLRFVGRNDLPLRWWNASVLRTDEWQWRNGRWWVVPGKV